jgi:very-long-chain enoyl-CoA reductase
MFHLLWRGSVTDVSLAPASDSTSLIKAAVKISNLNPARVRLLFTHNGSSIELDPNQRLSDIKATDFEIIDSGPQISPLVDNLLEYLGSIIIWTSLVLLLKPRTGDYIEVATLMWILHFGKRSLECLFVHRFSRSTIPIFSIKCNSAFKNCLYYWIFSAVIAAAVIRASRSASDGSQIQEIGITVFVVSEIVNGYCHLALRRLRPAGAVGHFKPTGFLFDRITAPNYTFEILAWVGFAMYTQVVVAALFPICGGVQMFLWADEKRRRLAIRWPEVANRGRLGPFKWM